MTRSLMITEADLRRLHMEFRDSTDGFPGGRDVVDAWAPELRNVRIVPLEHAPPDLVTLDSRVELRDLHTHESQACTLVCRADDGGMEGAVSAFTPAGIALLGSRVGDRVAWWADSALQMARVERILHQPEAAERELRAAFDDGAGSREPFLDFDPVYADEVRPDVWARA